jgi:transposase
MVFDFRSRSNTWIEKALVPELKSGQVVVMDDAAFHKDRRTQELIEGAGCTLLLLLPHSPDLNPVEKFWANLKRKLADILHLFPSFADALHHAFVCLS